MTTSNSSWKTSFATKALCLFLSGLTACSSVNPSSVHREPFVKQHDGASETTVGGTEYVDHWGVKGDENPADPLIAPGFQVALKCPADSKLNGNYRVDYDGNLQLPYDVAVNTTGDTLSDLKKKLIEVYRPYFKTTSDIEVRIDERRYWLDVRGLVAKPGRYLVEKETSLDAVIGLAGGTSLASVPPYVRIQKGNRAFVFDLNEYYSEGEDHPQIQSWIGGEIVFFQKEPAPVAGLHSPTSPYRTPIYMLGEVRKPGAVTSTPGGDFVDALVQAGGFTERADLDNIELVRRVGGVKHFYEFSWNDIAQAPRPAEGDVIIVHPDNTTKFERHVTLTGVILGALASIATSVILVLAYNKGRV